MKKLVIILVGMVLVACGGGGGEPPPYEAYFGGGEFPPYESCGGGEPPPYELEYQSVDISEHIYSWTDDIERFRAHVARFHPKFLHEDLVNLPHNIEIRAAFNEHLDLLLDNLAYLTDFEIGLELQRAAALFRDDHLFFLGTIPPVRSDNRAFLQPLITERYSLRFGWFSDGFYLYEADENFAHALGHRLLAINDKSVDEMLDEFSRFWSVENIYGTRVAFAQNLNIPAVLNIVGDRDLARETTYTFLGDNGAEFSIVANETAIWHENEYWQPWSSPQALVSVRREGEEPLFMQNAASAHWYTFLEEYGILYIRINGFMMRYDPNFPDYVQNAMKQNLGNIRAVIIDARNNPGGSDPAYRGLFEFLAENTMPDRLFYFMNEGSRSASLLAAGHLYSLGATLVGQPSAQNTIFYAFHHDGFTPTITHLRNSRYEISAPNVHYNLDIYGISPEDLILRPHVHIEYTIDDYIMGRDPYLEYVVMLLAN